MVQVYQTKDQTAVFSYRTEEPALPVLQPYQNPHNLKICVLMKTFRGEEFISPAILSVYNYVSRIVIVNSNISWTGWRNNTCIAEIEKLKGTADPFNKIISLRYDTQDQAAQVDFGFQFIKKNLHADYVMLLDTDEVWDDSDLVRALDFIHARPNHKVYRCQMRTYIKHPLYRLSNIELCNPVAFVNARLHDMGGGWRANNLEGPTMPGVFFHHFIHVRKDFNTVLEKIITSHASEGFAYQDMSEWICEVWDKLPHLEGKWKAGFHPNTDYPASWRDIEEITVKDLPAVLQNNSFAILERYGVMNKVDKRPEPTKQFVVDPIRSCTINPPCRFCYHLHTREQWASYTWSWEKTRQCIDDGIARGNTHLQVTGGEPTIFPHINQLIEYALSRGVKSSIITNGIVSKEKAESLLASGLDSFLVSRHGLRETHDYVTCPSAYDKQVQFLNYIADKIELRFNCVISKFNQDEIFKIAVELAAFRPKTVNFINMNPHEKWSQDAETISRVIADLNVVSPLLNRAIEYLESVDIIAKVRYFPFCCLKPDYWGNVFNDKLVVFDQDEWDYCISPKTFEAHARWGEQTSNCIEEKGEPCCACDIHHICGGANKAFHSVSNAIYGERLKPVSDPRLRELPFYYYFMAKKDMR